MKVNGMTVRYLGQLVSPNYRERTTEEFISLDAAREYLRDLYCGTSGDEMLMYPVGAHESRGEAYSRMESTDNISHILKWGPRGGIITERV